MRKPLSKKSYEKVAKSSKPKKKKTLSVSQQFFLNTKKKPKVTSRVETVKRLIDGKLTESYEVVVEINGIKKDSFLTPPPMQGKAIKNRFSATELRKFEGLLEGFQPDHLGTEPYPKNLLKPTSRIPQKMTPGRKYPTTIFGNDQRRIFRDTSYPWAPFGRCETNLGPFSGALIGPRHLLTCNHGIDWNAPEGFAANWLRFTPSYYNGNSPFGSTFATHIYWVKKNDNDRFIAGDEDQYDYAVVVLNDRIGDLTGWLGTRRYTDEWDGIKAWWHIGYPSDLTSVERPTYQNWFSLDGDNTQSDKHQAMYHKADVFPGQSGGPMFGFWEGDVGPRAVAVQSWQNTTTNGASGGGDLVDLAIKARQDFP